MPTLNELISAALAPGVALTSVIFYNTSLQNRFIYITGRTRDLNKEARQLRAEDAERHRDRLASIRWQVRLLNRRSRIIRKSVLIVYVALLSFIFTILELLGQTVFHWRALEILALVSFGLGFIALAVSTLYSWLEMALGQSSIVEDTRNSFPEGLAGPPPGGEFLPRWMDH